MNLSTGYNAYQLSEEERTNLSRLADYTSVQSMPEIWPLAATRFSDIIALSDPYAKTPLKLTYAEFAENIKQFATGLQQLGLEPGDDLIPTRVALFADNSCRWMIADQAIMAAGGANVVRSSQAETQELLYILENSGSTGLVVEDLATLKKLRFKLDELPVKWVVLLSDETVPEDNLTVKNYTQIMEAGSGKSLKPFKHTKETLATLLYTSGTTGQPKGVMLTHGNLLHQVTTLGTIITPKPGECVLSILPTWHSYERSAEYFLLSQGCTQIYTNLRNVKRDIKEYKPHYMVGVPRLWESIYEGIQKQLRDQPANKQKLVKNLLSFSQQYIQARRIVKGLTLTTEMPTAAEKLKAAVQMAALWPLHALGDRLVYGKIREATGGRIKYVLSGGGSLATFLDTFYETVGIEVLVGYGLTETSPVLTARRYWHNLRGSAGRPIPGTEIKIVDPETRAPLPTGQRGLVLARGPQVMQGYYKNEKATQKAIDSEGWFDTGDLGWLTPGNDLVLTGRAKDTIVLTNGENIEPQPIEDACLRSAYIDQIMVVGQDQKVLGALIVANVDAVRGWAATQNMNLPSDPAQIDWGNKSLQDLFRQELNREVKNRPGYRADDRIGPVRILSMPFTIENGMMTQTLKIKRPVVMEHYRDMIDGMFS